MLTKTIELDRPTLQLIRDQARYQASVGRALAGIARHMERLADAADEVDAMLAREGATRLADLRGAE